MKFGYCKATNFGSYPNIEFNLNKSPGLNLIYGKTGSGKSMLVDIPCWILFGITAKNGSVDEVRSWLNPDMPTSGILEVDLQNGKIFVTRIRGKQGQNDLYWMESDSDLRHHRGKDLNDTQKLLSARLGVDSTLYLSASYFCDFSPSGQFFSAKASSRRELFEKIANLDLAISIGFKSTENRKSLNKLLDAVEDKLIVQKSRVDQFQTSLLDLEKQAFQWDEKLEKIQTDLNSKLNIAKKKSEEIPGIQAEMTDISEQIADINWRTPAYKKAQQDLAESKSSFKIWSDEHNRLSKLDHDVCPTCLSDQKDNINKHMRMQELEHKIKTSKHDVERLEDAITRFEDLFHQSSLLNKEWCVLNEKERAIKTELSNAKKELASLSDENPFIGMIEANSINLEKAEKILESLDIEEDYLVKQIARLNKLIDLSSQLRGALLQKAVSDIQNNTNSLLEKYFDAELRVNLTLEGSDSLDVVIQKSGYSCVFRQLSKGQRQLLKLCFAVSVMKASSNSAGIHFDNLFFDEALDGLDDDLKVKAFDLFSELSMNHQSILMIDHAPSFQNLFENKYHVTIEGDVSSIEHE